MGAATNVTLLPGHTGLSEAEIITLTGVLRFLVIKTGLDVAWVGEAHVRLEVIKQVIKSPSTGE